MIREAEISWEQNDPRRVTIQDALDGRLRITFQQEHALDGCPAKGVLLKEFEAFSFDEGPLVHAEFEVTNLEPLMAHGQNYRFASVKLIAASTEQ